MVFGEDQGIDPSDNPYQFRDVGVDGEEGTIAIIEGIYNIGANEDLGVMVFQSSGTGSSALNGVHSFLIELLR